MNTAGALATLAAVLVIGVGTTGHGAEPAFETEQGWGWHLRPIHAGWGLTAQQGMVLRLDELKGEKLLLTMAHTQDSVKDVVRLRPVAFDGAGKRVEFRNDSSGSTGNAALKAYVMDLKEMPQDRIKFIGIEKLTREGLEKVVAPAAHRKLREAGAEVNVLAYPKVGEPYEFELTTIDGKKISSKDLRGKVVLLDFWAKWCGPCMAKMPKLKQTYARLNGAGLEVVGVNHDNDLETAKRVIAEQKLPWANVMAPTAEEQRTLWYAASGTQALPRLLLIDREGVLRAEVSPYQLEAEIEKLVGKP
jgi:thiol-disulfide isomerase/thioredoxin